MLPAGAVMALLSTVLVTSAVAPLAVSDTSPEVSPPRTVSRPSWSLSVMLPSLTTLISPEVLTSSPLSSKTAPPIVRSPLWTSVMPPVSV